MRQGITNLMRVAFLGLGCFASLPAFGQTSDFKIPAASTSLKTSTVSPAMKVPATSSLVTPSVKVPVTTAPTVSPVKVPAPAPSAPMDLKSVLQNFPPIQMGADNFYADIREQDVTNLCGSGVFNPGSETAINTLRMSVARLASDLMRKKFEGFQSCVNNCATSVLASLETSNGSLGITLVDPHGELVDTPQEVVPYCQNLCSQ